MAGEVINNSGRPFQSVLLTLQGGLRFSQGCCPWEAACVRGDLQFWVSAVAGLETWRRFATGSLLEGRVLESWSGEGSFISSLKLGGSPLLGHCE